MPKEEELEGWYQASAQAGQRPHLSCAPGARTGGQLEGTEGRNGPRSCPYWQSQIQGS